ncbi:MAG: hypothetical protein R2794_04810 [Chitinophagales bacterium]
MARKYIFYKRKTAIIFTDCLLFAAALSIYEVFSFKYHWSLGIMTFLGLLFGFSYAFFTFRIFRYIMSVIFSILYGAIFKDYALLAGAFFLTNGVRGEVVNPNFDPDINV